MSVKHELDSEVLQLWVKSIASRSRQTDGRVVVEVEEGWRPYYTVFYAWGPKCPACGGVKREKRFVSSKRYIYIYIYITTRLKSALQQFRIQYAKSKYLFE